MERNKSRECLLIAGSPFEPEVDPSESYNARYESVADPYDHTPTIVSEFLQSSLREAITPSNPVTYTPTARLCYLALCGQSPRNPQLKPTY